MKKIVVLISGQGSNLQALIDACQQGQISAKIVAVFSNKGRLTVFSAPKRQVLPLTRWTPTLTRIARRSTQPWPTPSTNISLIWWYWLVICVSSNRRSCSAMLAAC